MKFCFHRSETKRRRKHLAFMSRVDYPLNIACFDVKALMMTTKKTLKINLLEVANLAYTNQVAAKCLTELMHV